MSLSKKGTLYCDICDIMGNHTRNNCWKRNNPCSHCVKAGISVSNHTTEFCWGNKIPCQLCLTNGLNIKLCMHSPNKCNSLRKKFVLNESSIDKPSNFTNNKLIICKICTALGIDNINHEQKDCDYELCEICVSLGIPINYALHAASKCVNYNYRHQVINDPVMSYKVKILQPNSINNSIMSYKDKILQSNLNNKHNIEKTLTPSQIYFNIAKTSTELTYLIELNKTVENNNITSENNISSENYNIFDCNNLCWKNLSPTLINFNDL